MHRSLEAFAPNPELDLSFSRVVDIRPELVWMAWTTPEHLLKWFTPTPWQTVACEIDLRPGGRFSTTMRSPEGQNYANTACYLWVETHRRLVWTNALAPGFRPCLPQGEKPCDSFAFTAVLTLEPHGSGTLYTATVIHADAAGRKQHEDMGFHEGWGKALDQLVASVAGM